MFSNFLPKGGLNYRWQTFALLILATMLLISLLTTSQVLAGSPPEVTPPGDIVMEAESADGTPATNPDVAAFLQGAAAEHEGEI